MDIPKIDRLLDFSPSIMLVGRGLDKNLVKGQDIAVTEIEVPVSLPEQDMDALAIDYVGRIPSREFYEEFSYLPPLAKYKMSSKDPIVQ